MKVLVTVLCFVVSGCSASLKYFPVEGPLSKADGKKLYLGTLTNKYENSGKLTLKMDSGVTCDGQWSSASTASYGSMFGASGGSFASGSGMAVGGQTTGGGVMTCTDGNLIDVQLAMGDGSGTGTGIAKDKNGNVFRIIFE